jgi:plastocyanin
LSHRIRALCIAVVAVVAILLPNAALAQATRLNATVGPGFTISLRDASGANVTHLPVGTYEIAVNDQGIEHNFHLSGPGVDMRTEVEQVGTTTWRVTFTDAVYRFQCDPHANSMFGLFAVGTATLPPPPPPPPPPSPPPPAGVKTLTATVGPGATITLKQGSKKVSRLKAGRYRIVVRDRSHMHNFHLTGPGLNKKTAVAAHRTYTWTVRLRKGTYRYVCDPHKKLMRGSFRVT